MVFYLVCSLVWGLSTNNPTYVLKISEAHYKESDVAGPSHTYGTEVGDASHVVGQTTDIFFEKSF